MNSLSKEIIKVIKYFSFFSYAPTFEEIYTFLPIKTSRRLFILRLNEIVEAGKLVKRDQVKGNTVLNTQFLTINSQLSTLNSVRYTLPQYSSFLRFYNKKRLLSQSKLKKIDLYIKFLSFIPQIHFVGLTGSVAMYNAKDADDIDLFIVGSIGKMWTARFIANILAMLLGIKRKRRVKKARDKVCLNLFFDASSLLISKNKQTEYIAHEVLQMKPLINKKNTYEKFLWFNRWVLNIYPNARKVYDQSLERIFSKEVKKEETVYSHRSKLVLMDILEKFLRRIQLVSINKHKTNEIVTDTQLWFFPDDFEKKINSSSC